MIQGWEMLSTKTQAVMMKELVLRHLSALPSVSVFSNSLLAFSDGPFQSTTTFHTQAWEEASLLPSR